MTPLAASIVKQKILSPKAREKNYEAVLPLMEDFHCFEITEIGPVIEDLTSKFMTDVPISEAMPSGLRETIFLPAPRTWIEWKEDGHRSATYLVDKGNGWADCFCFYHNTFVYKTRFDLEARRRWRDFSDGTSELENETWPAIPLILINTPKIIGRRQHMPNRGLERRLTQGLKGGKFPLHAWTEITLNISKPMEIDDGEPHEAHLTGRRALHFCRKHIRIRNGKLEYVSAHWRGDPSIGIKQSRYRMVA